jgi:hypothetical protein
MATTRTITVHDHEVVVRTVEVPDETVPNALFRGGRRGTVFAVGIAGTIAAAALLPAIVDALH